MTAQSSTGIGQELMAVPIPDMVREMGQAIAEAQLNLDMTSLRVAQMMSGLPYEVDGEEQEGQKIAFGGRELSLLELGFTPTFYQFVDTIIEVKMSISMSRSTETKVSTSASFSSWLSPVSVSVNASYASKYQYSAEGSSLIRTKLVPVPPPVVLEERIRLLMASQAAAQAAEEDDLDMSLEL